MMKPFLIRAKVRIDPNHNHDYVISILVYLTNTFILDGLTCWNSGNRMIGPV